MAVQIFHQICHGKILKSLHQKIGKGPFKSNSPFLMVKLNLQPSKLNKDIFLKVKPQLINHKA